MIIICDKSTIQSLNGDEAFWLGIQYRVNVVPIVLPPLRERRDDIPLLAAEYVRRYSAAFNVAPKGITAAALAELARYDWPGNIRELRNVIRTALAISEGGVVRLIDLPREIREPPALSAGAAPVVQAAAGTAVPVEAEPLETCANPLQAAERAALLKVIEKCRGNMTHAAEHLGVSRNTLYRKMKTHGIPTRSGS